MNISDMVGEVKAAVVRPGDVAVISIDRYLSGQQLAEIGKHLQRRLPNIAVVVLQKGMTIDLIKGLNPQPVVLNEAAAPAATDGNPS